MLSGTWNKDGTTSSKTDVTVSWATSPCLISLFQFKVQTAKFETLKKVQILLRRFQETQLYVIKLPNNASILSYKLILPL